MASIQGRTLNWTVVGAVAGLGALVWAVATFVGADPAPASSQDGGNVTITAGGDVVNQYDLRQAVPESADDSEVRKVAERYAESTPGAFPAPFVVVDTEDEGLIVRTTGETDGRQIGTLKNRSVLWAECMTDTGFNADPTTSGGGVWLKIHWPSTQETTAFLKSQPSDALQGWVYSGYVVPVGHNGRIPTC